MRRVKRYLGVFKDAASAFMQDNCIKLSAALSYYTIFSIGPLLVIVISLLGLFFGQDAVRGRLFDQIQGVVGVEAAAQIQDIILNIQKTETGTIGTIIGTIILIVGATGIFTEIQDSINFIWSLRAKPKRGLLKLLINRLLSFSLIVSLGFLLLVSLVVSTLMDLLSDRLTRLFPKPTVYVFYVLNHVLVFVIITILFSIIFKVLPDGKIKWKDSIIGAAFTAILFLIGKAGIGYYIGNSNLGVTYGTAASIIIILTWVYYTSIILYFGAEFTKVYALEHGGGIVPSNTAVFIIKQEAKEIDPLLKKVQTEAKN
jgi:membrane protein